MTLARAARTWSWLRSLGATGARGLDYWRTVPPGSRALILGAIFLLFSTIGFLNDVVSLGRPPFAHVLATAAFSGTLAIAYAVAGIVAPRWLPAVALAHLAITVAIGRAAPAASALAPLDPGALAARLRLDLFGIAVGVFGAYTLFVMFVSREGHRSVRVHAEMALAAEIHRTLVPVVSGRAGAFEIHGVSFAAGEVGGDLVDLVQHDGRLLAYVADVSGHGVQAAVLMGMVKSAVRMHAGGPAPPAALLADLNRVLRPLRRPGMFVTLGALHGPSDGPLDCTTAGHLPLLHVRPAEGGDATVREERLPQVALGMAEGLPFAWRTVPTVPGDLLAIVSDGLTEVFDAHDDDFGLEGVKAALARHARDPLEVVAARVVESVRRHGPQTDDQTILLVRHLAGPAR